MSKIIPPGGKHLIVDLYGCDSKALGDITKISETCRTAALRTGATIIREDFHHFGEGQGVSGVILLAESHLSIHTWPENAFASIDVYVCGECDPTKAFGVLGAAFQAQSHTSVLIERGTEGSMTSMFSARNFENSGRYGW